MTHCIWGTVRPAPAEAPPPAGIKLGMTGGV